VDFATQSGTPWDSLVTDYAVAESVELTGEHDTVGRSKVTLKILSQPEELKEIEIFLRVALVVGDLTGLLASSLDFVRALRLTHEDREGHSSSYYLILRKSAGVSMTPNPPPPFQSVYIGTHGRPLPQEDASRFGELVRTKSENLLVGALQIVEPRLRALASIPIGGLSTIHADVGLNNLIPLPLMGDGMTGLASLLLAIITTRGGVVLIDEIENGLHHSVLRDVWQVIDKAATSSNTQVFATTHSLECISAAQEAFHNANSDNFRLHRLERIDGHVQVVSYRQDVLEAAIEANLEVR
jgi:hypothetical protein